MKLKHIYKDFSKYKKMFDFSAYSVKSKFYDKSNKLVVGKIKGERASILTEAFVGLSPKIYSFLVDNISEHEIGTYEINKISYHALMIKHISKTLGMMD